MLRGERMFCFPSSIFLCSLSDLPSTLAGQKVLSVTGECFVFPAAEPGGFQVVKMVIMVAVVYFSHLLGSLRSNQLVTHK